MRLRVFKLKMPYIDSSAHRAVEARIERQVMTLCGTQEASLTPPDAHVQKDWRYIDIFPAARLNPVSQSSHQEDMPRPHHLASEGTSQAASGTVGHWRRATAHPVTPCEENTNPYASERGGQTVREATALATPLPPPTPAVRIRTSSNPSSSADCRPPRTGAPACNHSEPTAGATGTIVCSLQVQSFPPIGQGDDILDRAKSRGRQIASHQGSSLRGDGSQKAITQVDVLQQSPCSNAGPCLTSGTTSKRFSIPW